MTKPSKPKANWLSWTLLVLSFTAACWFLSQWQFDRQAEVVAKNNLIEANYGKASQSLNSLLSPQDDWNTNLEFRTVLVEGQYLPEQSYLVRNRPLNAYPGFLQLVAFRSEQGSILWVERGWLATGSESDTPDDVPVIDPLSRTIEVRLRPAEPDLDRTAPEGQLSSIYLGEISKTFDQSIVYAQAYGRLISESPKLESGQQIAKPILSEGNHLSYAMQWILFGLMAIGAVVWTLSQERRRQAGLSPRSLRFLNTDKDGEIEDNLLN